MKQLRDEGQMRNPQEQKAFECAEWRRRHPPSKHPGEVLFESSQEPPECDAPRDNKEYEVLKQREKDVDAIIDKQLKEQSTK